MLPKHRLACIEDIQSDNRYLAVMPSDVERTCLADGFVHDDGRTW